MVTVRKAWGLLALLSLSGCINNSEKCASAQHNVFMQLILESTALHAAVESMKPLINATIKEELRLDKDFEYDFFLTKKRYALTLYYLNDLYEDSQKSVFSALDDAAEKLRPLPQKITFSDDLKFFGPTNDELVILMNDTEGELKSMHSVVKDIVYEVDATYKSTHKRDLFNREKAERYPFLPHITLGRIRSHSIKERIKDPEQVNKIFARIQERTKKIALSALEKFFAKAGQNVSFSMICATDPRVSKTDGLATILKSW